MTTHDEPAAGPTLPPTAPTPPESPPPTVAPQVPAPPAARGDAAWTGPATRWVSLLAATGLVVYLCWLMLAPFVDVLMWAVVLAVVFHPVHARIAARTKRPSLAAVLSCLLVVFAILLPLALLTGAVVRDASKAAEYVQSHKGELLDPAADTAVGRGLRWVDQYVDVDRFRSKEYVAGRVREIGGQVAGRTLGLVGGVVGVVVQFFFVIFTMFYLFRDGDALRAGLRTFLPLDRWQAHEVFLRTREVIQASVYGSLVVALVQGALGAVAFLVLGVPSALLWGAIMVLLCMVPMLGSFLVWVPAALYLLAAGSWVKAIILTAWGALVIGSIDNVLRPKLVGGRTRLHELVVFFAVLGGIQVFGVLGIVTGPAVAAVAVALFEVWRRTKGMTADGPAVVAVAPVPVRAIDSATPPVSTTV